MNPIDNDNNISSAVSLGLRLRALRKASGMSIAALADQLGRPREWLNRIELGYSEYGEHRPLSQGELSALLQLIRATDMHEREVLIELVADAEKEYVQFKKQTPKARKSVGKLTQAEVVMGEEAVVDAIVEVIRQQHSDAVIRNTGIRSQGSFVLRTEYWNRYRETLGTFLTENPNSVFKRVEYVASKEYLDSAKESDSKIAGTRKLTEVHNAKVKFRTHNPLSLHLLIGQREAVLALPRSSGQPGSNMALVVRDKLFVEALRLWYDEVLWEGTESFKMVDFSKFDESFEEIKGMYGF